MSFIVTISLIFSLLVGGGAGLAYVADGSAPGDFLYDLDRAIESLQYTLTLGPTDRSQRALGFAEERLNELKQLVAEGAPPDLIEQAAMGYGVSIYQAVDAANAVGVSGPDQALIDSEVLRALLIESLSTHTGVLTQVRDQVAEQAKSSIDLAIGYSQIGQTMAEEIFAEGIPDGLPEGVPAGMPEGLPDGLPEGVPAGPSEEIQGLEGAGDAADIEARIGNLFAWTDAIKSMADQGRLAELEVTLGEYANEVDELAKALAEVSHDEARTEALAALLDEALARHSEVLNAVLASVPEQAKPFVDEAIAASDRVREIVEGVLGVGETGGPPEGVPAEQPPGYGGGNP